MIWTNANYFLRWLYSQRYFWRLNNRRRKAILYINVYLLKTPSYKTLSFETGTARNDCVVPGTLTDSYCEVILLNKGLNLLLLFPKGN